MCVRSFAAAAASLVLAGCGSTTLARFPETPMLAAVDVRADFETWMREMAALNPDLTLRTDVAAFKAARGEVSEAITGPMTQLETWRLFARINPTLNDGHNLIAMPDQYRWVKDYVSAGGRLFPYGVHIDDENRLLVATAPPASFVAPRDEIVAINGTPAKRIVAEILARTHGDTARFRAALASRRFAFLHLYLYGDVRTYEIVARTPAGARKRAVVGGAAALPALLDPDAPPETHFAFNILEGGVGYLRAGTFDPEHTEYFRAFARDAFRRLRDERARALIIDIRDNPGGDDRMWMEDLMANFTARPYRHTSRYAIRITADNADPGDVVGDVQRGEIKRMTAPDPSNPIRFNGPVYILVGPYTYSSAILFAIAAQDHGLATIAGAETGGLACQTGRTTRIDLPRSKLAAFTPILHFTRPSGEGCERGVAPDLRIANDPFDPEAAIEDLRRAALERL